MKVRFTDNIVYSLHFEFKFSIGGDKIQTVSFQSDKCNLIDHKETAIGDGKIFYDYLLSHLNQNDIIVNVGEEDIEITSVDIKHVVEDPSNIDFNDIYIFDNYRELMHHEISNHNQKEN